MQNLAEHSLIICRTVLITQQETDQACTLFCKARVCHSLWKIAGAVYPLVSLPPQVCSHLPQVRAVGSSTRAFTPRVSSFRTFKRTYWGQNHEYIKEKDREKNAYENLKANDFIQTTGLDKYKIAKPKTATSDLRSACCSVEGFVRPTLDFRCGIISLAYILTTCPILIS